MGVKIRDICTMAEISLKKLSGKKIALDGMNTIYQFLARIRQPDGTPLKDSQGRITSHLSGIFYRTVNLLEKNIRPVFIFDGEPPLLKKETVIEREEMREKATLKWKEALEIGDIEEASKWAQASSKLTDEMIENSKELINAIGIPQVQAPTEGEAQAAFMTQKGDVWCSSSQDYDSLLFGAERLVRNLTISGKRKIPRKKEFKEINPEIINLEELLDTLEITREQLIDIGIMVGTDYNSGIRRIGSKTALKLIKQYESLEQILKAKQIKFDAPIEQIREIFLKPKITENYLLRWEDPNENRIKEILCEEYEFSQTRVEKALERFKKPKIVGAQASLEKWFSKIE